MQTVVHNVLPCAVKEFIVSNYSWVIKLKFLLNK